MARKSVSGKLFQNSRRMTGKPEVMLTGKVPDCRLTGSDLRRFARLFGGGGGPIGEGNGAATTNHRRNHVVETFVIFCGIIQDELRSES